LQKKPGVVQKAKHALKMGAIKASHKWYDKMNELENRMHAFNNKVFRNKKQKKVSAG
jgi:hypothetical protein